MPLSPADRNAFELDCYGCTEAQHVAGIDDLVRHQFSRFGDDANRALASILSDAQSLLEAGRTDQARHFLNRVKHALFEAAPMRLWQMGEVRANAEIAHECSEQIRLASRKLGFDYSTRERDEAISIIRGNGYDGGITVEMVRECIAEQRRIAASTVAR